MALIENDMDKIMRQLYGIEARVDMDLQPRPTFMQKVSVPKIRKPSFFKKLWIGFIEEMKQ